MYGAHLKASAAMVRLRLYDVLALLPPDTYEGQHFKIRFQKVIIQFILQASAYYVGNKLKIIIMWNCMINAIKTFQQVLTSNLQKHHI